MTDFQTEISSLTQLSTSLQDARIANNMTQTELATATGIPRPWINQLEHGHIANPSFTRILKIMAALKMSISINYVVTDTPQDGPRQDVKQPAPTETSPSGQTYAQVAKGLSSSVETLPMTQLKEALAKFNSSLQPHFTEELSKTMQNVLAFYDRDFFDTYSVMLDRSKQVTQQAKDLERSTHNDLDDGETRQ
ncbi:helix-turn-helix transcriptional regulator [Bifidobacterium dentium]|uniref:helix-turn-helix domain-containing protein n=1 Tax=Bifidobacterium dentium TaxID=1689 RepID=UPI0013C258F2|nr:helix-turn-helix transcriptional regulator [Bifidobacterium dentium]NEG42818.1 helix-turn-helix transcriptional regulator [Bifidobacterium dentium]NEG53691.1 helix-turn-helix transcriptional regulator [Bifidobacterium dentium]